MRPSNLHQLGLNHLAIRVDDIAAASAHLIANGVQPLNDEMDYISRKLRFFQGPEGVTLELVEYVGPDASGDVLARSIGPQPSVSNSARMSSASSAPDRASSPSRTLAEMAALRSFSSMTFSSMVPADT